MEEGSEPSIRRLKRELHVGHATASCIHRALAARTKFPAHAEQAEQTEAAEELTAA